MKNIVKTIAPLLAGLLMMFSLIACGNDGKGAIHYDNLLVEVPDDISPVAVIIATTPTTPAAPAAPAENSLPVANITGEISIEEGSPLELDGSGSYDEDGEIVSYQWYYEGNPVGGEGPMLSYDTSSLPVGTHEFALLVTDDKGATGIKVIIITITAPAVFAITSTATLVTLEECNRVPAHNIATANAEGGVTYAIVAGNDGASFSVDSSTGVVTFIGNTPDFETKSSYTYDISANDGSTTLTQTISFAISDWSTQHNGLTYGCIPRDYADGSGRVWLDRNVGAENMCGNGPTSGPNCKGDFYQWGRDTDGHEIVGAVTTSVKAADINNAGVEFITDSTDWTKSGVDDNGAQRSAKWSAIDGSSVCPVGYKVPLITEWRTELDSWPGTTTGLPQSKAALEIHNAGIRNYNTGTVGGGITAYLWSSSVSDPSIVSGHNMVNFGGRSGNTRLISNLPYGMNVRCIRDAGIN